MLCFSFPLLVKCLSLQPYLVIIPTRNSGEIILLILLQILQIQQIHQILQHPQLAFTLRTPIHQAGVAWRSLGSLQLYQSRETISGVYNFQFCWSITVISAFCFHFQCNESITYTTHGGYEFLDNLEPLLQR